MLVLDESGEENGGEMSPDAAEAFHGFSADRPIKDSAGQGETRHGAMVVEIIRD